MERQSKFINVCIHDTFKRVSYGTIFSLLINEGYANVSMIKKYLNNDSNRYFELLLRNKVIEMFDLDKDMKQKIQDSREGMNDYNFKHMRAYRLTDAAFKIIKSSSKIIKYLKLNIKSTIQDILDQFKERRKRKINNRINKNNYENKLRSLDFNTILIKSGFISGSKPFEDVGIDNCLDFINIKLNQIPKLIPLCKTTLEKIESRIQRSLVKDKGKDNFVDGLTYYNNLKKENNN